MSKSIVSLIVANTPFIISFLMTSALVTLRRRANSPTVISSGTVIVMCFALRSAAMRFRRSASVSRFALRGLPRRWLRWLIFCFAATVSFFTLSYARRSYFSLYLSMLTLTVLVSTTRRDGALVVSPAGAAFCCGRLGWLPFALFFGAFCCAGRRSPFWFLLPRASCCAGFFSPGFACCGFFSCCRPFGFAAGFSSSAAGASFGWLRVAKYASKSFTAWSCVNLSNTMSSSFSSSAVMCFFGSLTYLARMSSTSLFGTFRSFATSCTLYFIIIIHITYPFPKRARRAHAPRLLPQAPASAFPQTRRRTRRARPPFCRWPRQYLPL